jgi:quercetin dioxygenase-like cupin family protein
MKRLFILAIVVVLFPQSASSKRKKEEAVMIAADAVKYGPVPPNLPAGAQVGVLHGNPFKKGLYAIRFKMPDGYKIPPHWHSRNEELTVISGTFLLSMGDKFDEATAHTLAAGAYHYLPRKMHHSAATKGETVLEIHGMGPFDINYLNPADDPSKAAKGEARKKETE